MDRRQVFGGMAGPRRQLTKHFVVPVPLTVVGTATGSVRDGLELRSTSGTVQPGTTTTAIWQKPV